MCIPNVLNPAPYNKLAFLLSVIWQIAYYINLMLHNDTVIQHVLALRYLDSCYSSYNDYRTLLVTGNQNIKAIKSRCSYHLSIAKEIYLNCLHASEFPEFIQTVLLAFRCKANLNILSFFLPAVDGYPEDLPFKGSPNNGDLLLFRHPYLQYFTLHQSQRISMKRVILSISW